MDDPHFYFTESAWYRNQPDGAVYMGKVFYSYKGEEPSGTTVEVKEGTISICPYVFSTDGGKKVEKVTLPDSVLYVDKQAFGEAESLKEVQLSKNIISTGVQIFKDTPNLKEIYIPQSLCAANAGMFNKSSIEKVYYEGTVAQWRSMFGISVNSQEFELETEVPFPY